MAGTDAACAGGGTAAGFAWAMAPVAIVPRLRLTRTARMLFVFMEFLPNASHLPEQEHLIFCSSRMLLGNPHRRIDGFAEGN